MAPDNPTKNEIEITLHRKRLQEIAEQDKLKIVLSVETKHLIESIAQDMKTEQSIGDVVELALELLIAARGKEIQIVDRGRIVESYNLWKPNTKG